MVEKRFDAVAMGSCYVDTNADNFPFDKQGIPTEIELVGQNYETVPGGSAVNFCRILGDLGLRTAFIGMCGGDSNGSTLERLLEQQGVQPALISQPDLLTNISFNMTNPAGEHIMLVAGTANAALTPELAIPKLKEVLPQTETLYLGGCFKLKAFVSAFDEIAALAQQSSTTLVVDHGRVPDNASEEMLEAVKRLVQQADYYLPSREEFCKVWGAATIEDGLRQLNEQAPETIVVVKDNANGAFYWEDDAMQQVATTKVDKIVNATGAGDSFNAGVMTGFARGLTLSDAIAYGNRVAAAKIQAKDLPLIELSQ